MVLGFIACLTHVSVGHLLSHTALKVIVKRHMNCEEISPEVLKASSVKF